MSDLTLPSFFKMNNVIQNYPWGSTTSLQDLFDIANPSSQHQAELWMGAHSNGCSQISVKGQPTLLSDFIATNPEAILGLNTQSKFGALPYLFKVLAAEKALSIQVHPSKAQAEIGFAKENADNVAYDSSNRNYKDANHKPELVFAITPYQAMNGFREINDIVVNFKALGIPVLNSLIDTFSKEQNSQGLQCFFQSILCIHGSMKQSAIQELLCYARNHKEDPLYALILDLAEQYPNDIGLFSPLILNVLTLQPGEAMFLGASTPHAYIQGTALEVMASSDNVIRAGLTPKYIDVPELVNCTLFEPKLEDDLLLLADEEAGNLHYHVPVSDFKFSVYQQVSGFTININSAEILFAVDAPVTVIDQKSKEITILKGESLFIPAYTQQYSVVCIGCFTRAYS